MAQRSPSLETLVAVNRASTLAEAVYAQLRHALLSGGMAAGEQMTTRTVAKVMNVSATPVREALGWLVAEGALEFGPNRTVRVPVLTLDQVDEIYDARILLEGLLAEGSVKDRSEESLDRLNAIVDAHEKAMALREYSTCARLNFEFKFAIYKAAQRKILLKVVEGFWLRTGPHIHLIYPTLTSENTFIAYHRDAITALKENDPMKLRTAIQRDLSEARSRMRAAISALTLQPPDE